MSSAYFSTHSHILLKDGAPADPESPILLARDQELGKLVGVSCPGCGSPFQIDRPQDPGYLTRTLDSPEGAPMTSASESAASKKQPKKISLDSNATSMTHAQYEEILQTLDPKLLQEMSNVVPDTPLAKESDAFSDQTASGSEGEQSAEHVQDGSETGATEIPLDRKPIVKPKGPQRLVCHRCHSLSHHASPLANSSTLPSVLFPSPPAPVPKHLETLAQSKTATVVLVVDLVDFPLSLPQPIIDELLKSKRNRTKAREQQDGFGKEYPTTPIILVGNKFDVMPVGTRKSDVIQVLQRFLEKHGLDENVRAIHLVSAKNPARDEIRSLLKSIGTSWSKSGKGNVVMVGAENVGKSQLLNAFLKESGRWRPNAQQVMRQKNGAEQVERQKKLSQLLGDSDESGKNEWAEMTGVASVGADIDQYEELYKDRGQEKLQKYKTTVSNVPGTTLEKIKVPLSVLSRFMGATYKEVQTKWLMDTPGVRVGAGQLTSWLTLDELKVSLPKKMLKPASFTLEEGKSFFLGGLVRIDCVSIGKKQEAILNNDATTENETTADDTATDAAEETRTRTRGSNPAPKITCFTTLPLHKTSTGSADRFLQKTLNGELTVLQPPFGSPERLAAFPGLAPVSEEDIVIVNNPLASPSFSNAISKLSEPHADELDPSSDAWNRLTRREHEAAMRQLTGRYGICDLVFSGVGWVMVSGKFKGEEQAVRLKVWTPKGQGAMVRDVCLLPELAANPVDKTAGGIRQKQKIMQALPKNNPGARTSGAEADDSSPSSVE
ncbi:hypothetical protein BG011_006153 [Mortierella polycephala]|uniref:G domain-containing protein n=1 Tax=Mortierella polycephala TaxID=41804 RepID=A0A9P6TZX8_9FUNG|nr:hypothetical protein BG011_006153 [Mortierella polycephala]